MADDISILLFEAARRAQAASLRRRRRARAKGPTAGQTAGETAAEDTGMDAAPAGPRTAGAGAAPEPRRLSPKQQLGSDYEDRALALLVRAGLRPLARNLGCRVGEIDLALRDGDTLVLVEVRARGDGRYGGAAASVGWAKQARLIRTARHLLPGLAARHWRGRQPRVRFDVVAFESGTPLWLRHAFDVPVR